MPHKLQLNKRMEPDNLVSPADVSGKTLVDIVEQWIESIKGDGAIEVGADTYVSVKNCYRFNDNILVADVMSGKTGESLASSTTSKVFRMISQSGGKAGSNV